MKLEYKTQIVYVPAHIPLNGAEPITYSYHGAQPGFVTSGPTPNGSYFCMYWQLDEKGVIIPDLRTKANSELTPGDRLIVIDTMRQEEVERVCRLYRGD